ncbi:formylglycine-generating enzyme family protein [uncultured Treponema sp.]|uniref:formylglycine-generating enzyme family protein n=1 Tax=uncultured Treponema sp. TaxID=162155 RepID=UPI0025EED291|nr:formylglycine-generating enzyme family protein [uncultured Treponema sp.]
MKSLKKCFSLAGGRKSGLPFARLLCALVMLTVPLTTSCGQKKVDVQKVLGKENYKASSLMIAVPGQNFSILATEVTQELYESVMGENPSEFKGEKNLPVEKVSWVDAVSFCNELSKKEGLDPVYSINGVTNVYRWGVGNDISEKIEWDEEANGYRLPTLEEWQYAAKGGQEFKYSGSDNLDEVGWYVENSDRKTHPVAQKKPNGYGLYDMSGNVWEWCWDSDPYGSYDRYFCGGSWNYGANYCEVDNGGWLDACSTYNSQGFRIVRSTGK